jgi:hypothetical protein
MDCPIRPPTIPTANSTSCKPLRARPGALYRVPVKQRNRLLATARTAWTIRRRHRPTRPDRGGVR